MSIGSVLFENGPEVINMEGRVEFCSRTNVSSDR